MDIRRARYFLRFSLRAMLLVLTVIGCWLGVHVNRASRQKAAVRWLAQHGAEVSYDWEFDEDDMYTGKTEPPGSATLRTFVGDDYFQRVVATTLHKADVDDISTLAKLHDLKWLYLTGTPVSDVSPLVGLTSLKELGLSNTKVSDLSVVGRLTDLTELTLVGAPVRNLSPLADLGQLQTLVLTETRVTDVSPLAEHCLSPA